MGKMVWNERLKLGAAILNTAAAAMFTVWDVAPGAALMYHPPVAPDLPTFLYGAPVGVGGAFLFHSAAQWLLGRLRE